MSSGTTKAAANQHQWFVTTHWSVVLSARAQNSPASERALETLCQTYWYPLYAYVRRQGRGPHDAQDLTQEFFARLLHADYLKSVAREKGRFRTFLLVAFKRFLANEWDRARAQKRGGGQIHLALDTSAAETRYRIEPAAQLDADRIYDRRWALTLLDQTLARLRAEFEAAGRAGDFDRLKPFLTADKNAVDYTALEKETGQAAGTLRVAVHRLRKRFREVFREAIADTVSGPGEVEGEMRHLLAALDQ